MANTLTIPASDAATLNLSTQTSTYSRTELSLEADVRTVLLAFDLSQLPAFTSAKLQYSTGAEISNGSLNVYLGSHSNWVNNNNSTAPDATVLVADAQGGWDANMRYESNLDASVLTQAPVTLITSISTGSDVLTLRATGSERPLPVLAITGNEGFCENWETNTTDNNTEIPEEENETIPVRRSGGSLSYWAFLILLSGLYRRRPVTRKT